MTTQNSGIPSPYGPFQTPLDPNGIPLGDVNNVAGAAAVPTLPEPLPSGVLPANATGSLSATGSVSVPAAVFSALLVELRVISNLLNMTSLNYDLAAMRADEYASTGGPSLN